MPGELYYAEQIRSLLPEIAAPIKPGEMIATWMDRAARATGVPAARLRAYWHRKVDAPRIPEYFAVVGAAEEAARRRQAIAELESEIQRRTKKLRTDHLRLVADHPVLGRLVPTPPSEEEAPQARVRRRREGAR